jgi:SNF2 family DNA or RNA helicase
MNRYNGKKLSSLKPKAKVSRPASIAVTKHSAWYAQLFDAQKKAADFILSRPATALFCQARTGKTYISMAVLELSSWRVAVIVAPLTSLGVVWQPKLLTLLQKCHIHSSPQALRSALKYDQDATRRHILLTNPEALRSSKKWIAKLPVDLLIWDESQNIKNRNSANSRIARRLRHVPRRIALSGTPLDKGQIDVWAQMRFVDHTILGEDWGSFADEYCYKGGFKNKKWFFSARKGPQFLATLKDHIYRLDDKFLKLTPIEVIPVPVLILGKQRTLYDTMQRDSLIVINGVTITANNAGARDVKLSQITGGAVLDREDIAHPTGRAKQRKLLHLLRRDEWPVVIFCQFLHEIDLILELFDHEPQQVAVIQGSVKEKERTHIVNQFQEGHYDVLICQVRTGGEAIDLTRASVLIFYSMSYSYINWEQVLRRVQGLNQKKSPKAYILYCEDTIDADKLQLVQDKGETSDEVLTHFTKE